MADLTSGQCAQLSFLAALNQTAENIVAWRTLAIGRYDLQYCVIKKAQHCADGNDPVWQWETLLWSNKWDRYQERIKSAGVYWDGALAVQDVLRAGKS